MRSYAEDVEFLKSCHIGILELSDRNTGSRICIVPQWQGRVMTSTPQGERGTSFGWINRALIASGSTLAHFNPVGGEERLWIGPEGGPNSFYFAPGAAQTYENWQVPAALDTQPFDAMEASGRKVRLTRELELTNASGNRFRIGIDRTVELLRPEESEFLRNLPAVRSLDTVAYRSRNRIINLGNEAWSAQSGAPSIWMLGMFPPTPSTTVFVPYADSGSGPVVNSDYFGPMPGNRLRVSPGLICMRIDGAFRSKIGIPAGRDTGCCGSYDPQAGSITLIRYTRSTAGDRYVESRWGEQTDPFGGDVINAYNDGPTETGTIMGPFYELETSSPAAFLDPGASRTHIQEVYHLQGDRAHLESVLDAVVPGGSAAVNQAFKS